MIWIFVLLGLWFFWGLEGLVLGFLMCVVVAVFKKIFSGNKNQPVQKDKQTHHTHKTNETSQSERLTMQDVAPFIDVVCHFALKYEPNWNKAKVRFVKEMFIDVADGRYDEIVYLRERMKLRNRPRFEESMMAVYERFQLEDSVIKQFILEKILIILTNTCHQSDAIRADAETFAKKAGMSYSEYASLIDSYVRNHEQSQQQEQHTHQQPHIHQSELEKHAEVLGVSPNATEEEIKRAYRQKIKDFHPDRNINVTSAVEEIIRKETQKLNIAKDYLLKNI